MNRFITTGVAAHEVGVSTATLTRWAAAGLITPAERTAGGHYRWDLPVLREQVRRLGRPASEQTAAEDIARVIHAANRELQIVQGDPRPSPPWDEAPEYQVRENVASVVAALAEPERTPEQNHQGWYDRLIADGWRHGPVKDEAAKTHPDLVPFDQLPEHEKQKDRLFMAIVRALAPEPKLPSST
jgi:DNA-binding transcriptional MerR regulator